MPTFLDPNRICRHCYYFELRGKSWGKCWYRLWDESPINLLLALDDPSWADQFDVRKPENACSSHRYCRIDEPRFVEHVETSGVAK